MCDEIERVARDASDPLLLGYALHTRAAVLLRRGDFAPALELYLEAIELYRPVPEPFSGLRALADLAICHLRLGRLDDAVAAAEESEAIVVRHGFRGFQPVNAAIAGADVFLHLAEQGSEAALGRARAAAKTAAKRSKVAVGGRAGRPPRPRQHRMAARTAARGAALVAAQPGGRRSPRERPTRRR